MDQHDPGGLCLGGEESQSLHDRLADVLGALLLLAVEGEDADVLRAQGTGGVDDPAQTLQLLLGRSCRRDLADRGSDGGDLHPAGVQDLLEPPGGGLVEIGDIDPPRRTHLDVLSSQGLQHRHLHDRVRIDLVPEARERPDRPLGMLLQPSAGLLGQAGHRRNDVEHLPGLIGLEHLQGGQLGVQQTRWHEVSGPLPQALLQQLPVTMQVHEDRVGGRTADQVPVTAAQRGAADHQGLGRLCGGPQHGTDLAQPGLAVGVVQRGTRAHLGDVRLRVQGVPVGELPTEALGQQLTHGGLAAAGDPHDHHAPRRRHHGCLSRDCGLLGAHQSWTVPSARRL